MNDLLTPARISVPGHVPDRLVTDFDVYNPSTDAERFHEAFVDMQQSTRHPFVWSPHHGGHWLAVRGPDVHALYGDHERFSSRYFFCRPHRARCRWARSRSTRRTTSRSAPSSTPG